MSYNVYVHVYTCTFGNPASSSNPNTVDRVMPVLESAMLIQSLILLVMVAFHSEVIDNIRIQSVILDTLGISDLKHTHIEREHLLCTCITGIKHTVYIHSNEIVY